MARHESIWQRGLTREIYSSAIQKVGAGRGYRWRRPELDHDAVNLLGEGDRALISTQPEPDFQPVVAGASGSQFVSPTSADGEANDERGAGALPDADDDDDEDLDGAVLIEDSEEADGDIADVHRKEES
jgi:hypothetical protein